MITYETLKYAYDVLTGLEELSKIREVTIRLELPGNRVSFPLSLNSGGEYTLTLPKEDFLSILDKNIAELADTLDELGFCENDVPGR